MPGPTRILFTIRDFITAGGGRAMLNIIEGLDRRRFAPAVCVERKGGALDAVVETLGIPFLEAPFTLPTRPYPSFPNRLWRAAQTFKPYRFELWHSYDYTGDYSEALIARMAGVRAWVYTKNNMGWAHRAVTQSGDNRRTGLEDVRMLWSARAYHLRTFFASAVAAQNHEMLRKFFTGAYRRKTRLIPPGIFMDRFHPDRAPTLGLRLRPGLRRTTLVGCVADLLPVKNHATLLEAVASTPDVHVFLAGRSSIDPRHAASLRLRAKQLHIDDRVTFLDYVDDVPAFLAELDIFVLPSKSEGCPLALLEAMAAGRACIASNIPGCQDVITSGVDGLLVSPGDPDALSQALKQLAGAPDARQQLGAAARRRIETHYSTEREVADYERLYADVLVPRRARFALRLRSGVEAAVMFSCDALDGALLDALPLFGA